jgi:hypothetical protein
MRALGMIDWGSDGSVWYRRAAELARELGDERALVGITANLFGRALNARDEDELARLRPQLREMAGAIPDGRQLAWIHYQLAIDACARGAHDDALADATIAAEQASLADDDYMLAAAEATLLLSRLMRDGTVERAELARVFEMVRVPAVVPMSVIALWLVARYAAEVDRDAAFANLVQAERLAATLDSQLWPECMLREETLARLGIGEAALLTDEVPELDRQAALAAAGDWVEAIAEHATDAAGAQRT